MTYFDAVITDYGDMLILLRKENTPEELIALADVFEKMDLYSQALDLYHRASATREIRNLIERNDLRLLACGITRHQATFRRHNRTQKRHEVTKPDKKTTREDTKAT